MPNYSGNWRWGATTSLGSIASGTAVASAVFGSQTRIVRVISSVGSCSVLISDAAVTSTVVDNTGMYIAPGFPEYFVVTPGQRINAHQQGVTTTSIFVTEGA